MLGKNILEEMPHSGPRVSNAEEESCFIWLLLALLGKIKFIFGLTSSSEERDI